MLHQKVTTHFSQIIKNKSLTIGASGGNWTYLIRLGESVCTGESGLSSLNICTCQ